MLFVCDQVSVPIRIDKQTHTHTWTSSDVSECEYLLPVHWPRHLRCSLLATCVLGVCVCVSERANAGVFVFTGFKCSFLSGDVVGWNFKRKKAEKSRTRTYGPPSVFQLTEERERSENLWKNGSRKSKAREFKKTTLTQLSNRFKPVHKMLKKGDDTFVFLEKNALKIRMGQAVERGKIAEGHCQINLFNVLPALGDIRRQSSSATPSAAHHQTGESLFYRVYASIFVQRW